MKIVVCIKQVPATQKVEVDLVTGVLKREGIETKLNPYDCYAIETALQIRKKTNAEIHVITMGPPSAKEVLQEAFALGVQEGWLLTDRQFAGADVLATSYALSQGIREIKDVDLIICGKQTTDGDTAQVGPAMAQLMRIPHISWVSKLVDVDVTKITVSQDMTNLSAMSQMHFPCLITVEKGIFEPNLPSYKQKKQAKDYPIHILTATQCSNLELSRIGLSGSPTQVERIFSPTHDVKTQRLEGTDKEKALQLVEYLIQMKVIEKGETPWQD